MRHARHATPRHGVRPSVETIRGRRRHRGPRSRRAVAGLAALLLAVALALQGLLALGMRAASAAMTRDGDSVYLSVGEYIHYGGTKITARMSINGEIAYCATPHEDTPKAGHYTRQPIQASAGDEAVRRTLFYGYGGPGFDVGLWRAGIGGTDGAGRYWTPGLDWDDTEITDAELQAYTHVLLAERVTGDEGLALYETVDRFRQWFSWNVLGHTYGSGGGSAENPNSVAARIDALEVPRGFDVYQLDTGDSSGQRPGFTSQTVVTFEYNPYVEVRFDKVSARPEITDGNAEYALAGATYDVFDAERDERVATITTDEGGSATLELRPDARYYAVETAAPRGFVRGVGRTEFSTGTGPGAVTLSDVPGTLTLELRKRDSATRGAAQAGATLEGAEYRVVDANGDAHVATTGADGRAVVSGLPLGRATVTETRAPEGYRLDATPRTYEVGSDELPAGGVAELAPVGDFDEHVIAFDLELVKYRDSGAEGSGLQDPAAGVHFEIVSGTTGQVVGSVTTDERGRATTAGSWFGAGERPEAVNGALPYDRAGYVVREVASTTPEGYLPAPDWDVTPAQMVDGTTLHYIVDNDFVATRVQLVKVDAASGQAVALAGFSFQLLGEGGTPVTQEVWYPNHEKISEFVTDESGCVTFPGRLAPGTYRVRETAAAAPYLVSGQELTITVEDTPELAPLCVAVFGDGQATGSAIIAKRCATGPADGDAGLLDEGCAGTLAGAEFDVVATHDVTSPDGRVQAVAGEVVAHLTTGEDGTATAEGLPLGAGEATYAFVETAPAPGHALDATPHEFTLTYADDRTAVVTSEVEAVNEPTVVTLDKGVLGRDEPLPGATFALLREGDAGEGGGEDGGLEPVEVARLVTDDAGRITLRHLCPGDYRLVEIEAPAGHLVNTEGARFTVDEHGLVEGAATCALSLEDDFTRVRLSKRDITSEEEVPGAHLSVLDAEGNEVESWVSGDEPHLVEALPVGTYTLVERMTPHDYDQATAVGFSVAPTGEVQTVVMYDRPIEVSGEVDKRQETADAGGGVAFDYAVDARSTSSTWVDELTVTDEVGAAAEGLAEVVGITTPVAAGDADGLLNVWYRTSCTPADHVDESGANATLADGHDNPWLTDESRAEALGDDGRALSYAGWRLWEEGVSATEARELDVADLGLAEGERVVAVRLEYGRAEAGFTTREGGWDRDGLKDLRDDVAEAAPEGESGLAPLVVRIRTTDAWRAGETMRNQAKVDLFRNGGGAKGLEGHDDDRVGQGLPTPVPLPVTGEATLPAAGVATLGIASLLLAARRRR